MRRLRADEAALWSHVAASVRPLAGNTRPPLAPLPPRIAEKPPSLPPPPKRAKSADKVPVEGATLDGGWDRAMMKGRLRPDFTVDLHGYTRDRAHALLKRCIEDAAISGSRVLLVITGKGARDSDDSANDSGRPRGVIRASLRGWLEHGDLRPWIAALRPAHPRHGGGGAWYVILRRR
jgi:DNA-nicking Smr family endonuclease